MPACKDVSILAKCGKALYLAGLRNKDGQITCSFLIPPTKVTVEYKLRNDKCVEIRERH